ncbi:MAG: ferrous iron transport protein A [Sphingomonas sp.]
MRKRSLPLPLPPLLTRQGSGDVMTHRRGRRAPSRARLIDNHSQIGHEQPMCLTLDQLDAATRATVADVDWSLLSESDARRLRNLGVDEGIAVETLHRAPFGDPMAVRIGRMRVALRRAAARAIRVEPAAS